MKRPRTTLVRLDHQEPEPIRKIARQGPTAVMRLRWRDPDDNSPLARTAREVDGHRAYCPLRWSYNRHGEAGYITDRHIYAADRLRGSWELATHGLSAQNDTFILSLQYGPRDIAQAAFVQTAALRDFRRAMAVFTTEQRLLVTSVVLFAHSMAAWCANRRERNQSGDPHTEGQRLVVCLNLLAEFYAAEIDEDLARDRLLVAA